MISWAFDHAVSSDLFNSAIFYLAYLFVSALKTYPYSKCLPAIFSGLDTSIISTSSQIKLILSFS